MEVLKMTFRDGIFLELESVLAIQLDDDEKKHIEDQYAKLKSVLCQPETVSIIDELEHYITQKKGKSAGIVE
jgi:hypothetical protein